ncbi:MAG TPA: DUF3108 domain-containing protein [Dehalococcoidia bacterium]|nr:DUF3108 domain-containing protein [Dehalococcoidia bacterium]
MACSSGRSGPPASDVAGTPPWPEDEIMTYRLVDDDGKQLAVGRLIVEVSQATGQTTLRQRFESETTEDSIDVVVDSRTLKPVSSRREIINDNPDDEDLIEVMYTEAGASVTIGDRQTGLSVPEHAYDNDSSLFLWRTLPFAEGYEGSYVTVITNRRSRQDVVLSVPRKETVTVPAGTFDCWRLEIATENARQVAWYADTPARPLIRYDNDRDVIFELTSRP